MKGITTEQFAIILNFVQKYHKFALWMSKEELALARKKYPKLDEHGFNIKYVDSVYDSRFSDIWSISFRGMGTTISFTTNTQCDVEYKFLFDWVMDFLKKEWIPSKQQLKQITK